MDFDGIDPKLFYPYKYAGRLIPGRRPGKAVCKRTVERWRSDGLLRDGTRVKLRAVRVGGD